MCICRQSWPPLIIIIVTTTVGRDILKVYGSQVVGGASSALILAMFSWQNCFAALPSWMNCFAALPTWINCFAAVPEIKQMQILLCSISWEKLFCSKFLKWKNRFLFCISSFMNEFLSISPFMKELLCSSSVSTKIIHCRYHVFYRCALVKDLLCSMKLWKQREKYKQPLNNEQTSTCHE